MNKVSSGLAPKNVSSPTSGSKCVANLLDELIEADFSGGADTKTAAILTQLTGADSREVRNWLEDPDANALEKRAKRLTNALEKTRCMEQNLWLALVDSGAPHDGEKKVDEDVIARTCLALARSQSHDLVVCEKLFDIVDTMEDQKTKKDLLISVARQLVGDPDSQWLSSAVMEPMTMSVLKLPGPAREKLISKLIETAGSCAVTDSATWQFIASLANPNGPADEFKISGGTFEKWINTLDENGVLDAQIWRQVLALATSAMLEENVPIVLDVLQRHECADRETWMAALTRMEPQSRASECHALMAQHHDMPAAFVDAIFRCMGDLDPEDVGKLLNILVRDPAKNTVSKALCQLHRLCAGCDARARVFRSPGHEIPGGRRNQRRPAAGGTSGRAGDR